MKSLQFYTGRPKIKSMTDQQAVVRMMMFLLVLLSPSPNKFRKSLEFKFKRGWIKNMSFQLKKVLVSLKNKIVKWALYHIEFLSCQISRYVSNNTGKTGKTALWVTWACIAWKVTRLDFFVSFVIADPEKSYSDLKLFFKSTLHLESIQWSVFWLTQSWFSVAI